MEKKLGMDGKSKGYNADGAGYVDAITDQFSNVRSPPHRRRSSVLTSRCSSTSIPERSDLIRKDPSLATEDTTTARSATMDPLAPTERWEASLRSTVPTVDRQRVSFSKSPPDRVLTMPTPLSQPLRRSSS
jgi:hypothetical protein